MAWPHWNHKSRGAQQCDKHEAKEQYQWVAFWLTQQNSLDYHDILSHSNSRLFKSHKDQVDFPSSWGFCLPFIYLHGYGSHSYGHFSHCADPVVLIGPTNNGHSPEVSYIAVVVLIWRSNLLRLYVLWIISDTTVVSLWWVAANCLGRPVPWIPLTFLVTVSATLVLALWNSFCWNQSTVLPLFFVCFIIVVES